MFYNVSEILSQLDEVILDLKHDKVILYPTETVAGIGCLGNSEIAVDRIFRIKQRSTDNPLSFAFSSVKMVEQYAEIPEKIKPFLSFLPGPLTLVLPRKSKSPALFGVKKESIGIRIPSSEWLRQLISKIGIPLVTTSANISGASAPSDFNDLDLDILDGVDIIVKWEEPLGGLPSTVISYDDGIKILRIGAISEETIQDIINRRK